MEKINFKEDLINYFKKGCKEENQVSIGVEHEKFVFDNNSNKRINFEMVSKIFNFLEQFGWKPKKENFANGTLWKYSKSVGPASKGAVTHPGAFKEIKCYADI